MAQSRLLRALFVGTLASLLVLVLAFTSWTLWPKWQQFRAVQELIQAVQASDVLPAKGVKAPAGAGPDLLRIQEAAQAARRLGASEAAVADLTTLLRDTDVHVRRNVCIALSHFGVDAKPAAPALTRALSDDSAVRYYAASALVQTGADAKAAVPVFVEEMEDNGAWIVDRHVAALMLGRMGRDAKDAVPALTRALHHKEPAIARGAAEALKQIDPDAAAQAGVK